MFLLDFCLNFFILQVNYLFCFHVRKTSNQVIERVFAEKYRKHNQSPSIKKSNGVRTITSIKNQAVRQFVEKGIALCKPAKVHVCTGTEEEYNNFAKELVASGSLTFR